MLSSLFNLEVAATSLLILVGALAILWSRQLGWTRALLAAILRIGWLSPFLLALYPLTRSQPLPQALAVRPLHVLIDDSSSMSWRSRVGSRERNPVPYSQQAQGMLRRLEQYCLQSGCVVRKSLLSELATPTRDGYTPLSSVLDGWLMALGADPWLLLTDGGDWQPAQGWDENLRDAGKTLSSSTIARDVRERGVVVIFGEGEGSNVWIERVGSASFAFASKSSQIDVEVRRDQPLDKAERVQVQIFNVDQALASDNIEFLPGDSSAVVTMPIPALARGQHLLEVRVLPTANETAVWDNHVYLPIEVLPDTVGVLHLLGAPSWDGRFVRRFLKSEPKFDTISFFILRDPLDSQQLNERELSLIPFPVDRLFKEELGNFRLVVMQNFALHQFLERPEYRENLMKFVRDGGGLLFIGGPRALQTPDLDPSMLGSILPFVAPESGGGLQRFRMGRELGMTAVDHNGPYFDPELKFSIGMAQPSADSRALANIFDDWETLAKSFAAVGPLSGLHHTENIKFKPDESTPLLTAKTLAGQELPLAVASYPGKGRAIWLFTDHMWQLAMASDRQVARETYHKFLASTFEWLLRQELRKPLAAQGLTLRSGGDAGSHWSVRLRGPAVRYFNGDGNWRLQICGRQVPLADVSIERYGAEEVRASGVVGVTLTQGERCRLALEGEHAAFGAVKTELTAVMPRVYKDAELGGAPHKAAQLATLTGALAIAYDDQATTKVEKWLDNWVQKDHLLAQEQFETEPDHYWLLRRWWFFLLLLCMPLEVLVRRWHQIMG